MHGSFQQEYGKLGLTGSFYSTNEPQPINSLRPRKHACILLDNPNIMLVRDSYLLVYKYYVSKFGDVNTKVLSCLTFCDS